MPLENGRIRLVPKPEITACEMCGAGPLPGRMDYVSFDNNAQDVPAGAIETVDHQPGQVAYRRPRRIRPRDDHADRAQAAWCAQTASSTAAELVGYGDRAPLLAEIDELRKAGSTTSSSSTSSPRSSAPKPSSRCERPPSTSACSPPAARRQGRNRNRQAAVAREGLTMGA